MRYPGDEDGIGADEQQLADLLKRAVPEPPRQLTYEEITVRNVERTVKSWLVPTLAAASVLIVAGAVGAVAATRSGQSSPGTPAAYQGSGHPGPATPSARPTSPGCLPSAEPTPSAAQGGSVTVPSVLGQSEVTATAVLQQVGLIVTTKEVASQHVPAGTALLESPAAGARVPAGSMVTVTISAGSAGATPVPMPTSTCLTPVPAATPTPEPTAWSSPTAGAATATPVPAASSAVPRATPTAASRIAVPNCLGQTLNAAEQEAQAAGFMVRAQAQAAPAARSVPKGEVWSQTPAGGTAMPAGTEITLIYQP